MFSQLRQGVESLTAPHSPDSSTSLNGPPSASALADTALANLRKSLITKRSASPGPSPRLHKTTLEERLRASFSVGEASNATTPSTTPPVGRSRAMSAASTPLPDSPMVHSASPVEEKALDDDPITLATAPITEPATLAIATESPVSSHPLADPLLEPVPSPSPPATVVTPTNSEGDFEALQERLKLVEQRFADVSTSFKRLQAEKLAADAVLLELTPLETMKDAVALRDYLKNTKMKTELCQDEIRGLNQKLSTYDERIVELRDTHQKESKSRSEQFEKLQGHLRETEALLQASQDVVPVSSDSPELKAEVERLQTELEKAQKAGKDEEDKRVKAISLLKTVRQKLVKAEKEKDDLRHDLGISQEQERMAKLREENERSEWARDIETAHLERERAIQGIKGQFDKEVAGLTDRYDKEVAALKGQFELEAVTAKGNYSKEIAAKKAQIAQLQESLNVLTAEKNEFFSELQIRHAELESSQYHLESIQSQNTELQYQLKELEERGALLNEELSETRRDLSTRVHAPGPSSEDVTRLLAAAESKYEAKLADMRHSINTLEKERSESELDWSRNLKEKVKELDELRQLAGTAAKTKQFDAGVVDSLKADIVVLQQQGEAYKDEIKLLQQKIQHLHEAEGVSKAQEAELQVKINVLQQQVEQGNSRETQLRTSNKTLREELRKVQSSAALLERQRNPGVGYWRENGAATTPTTASRTSIDSPRMDSPAVSSPAPSSQEEEVNLEYLRNVILQFLEHKEMRPNLVKVLSIILHFTPQETRRLVAKV